MAFDLFDLTGPDGSDNDGGFKTKVWLAPERDFLELKGPKITGLPGDSVTIDGSHTFTAPKGFVTMYSTLDSGELKLEPTGERDGRGFKGTIELFYPGAGKDAAEFARRVKNLAAILIVELTDGTKVQLGSAGLGVELVGSWTSGKISGGRRGWTFTGEFFTNSQFFYEGDIVLKDAPVDPGV